MVVGLPCIRQGGSELLGHICCALLRSTVVVIITLECKNEGGDYAYLYGDVFQRIRGVNGEGDQDDM